MRDYVVLELHDPQYGDYGGVTHTEYYRSAEKAQDIMTERNAQIMVDINFQREQDYLYRLTKWQVEKAEHEALVLAGIREGEFAPPEPVPYDKLTEPGIWTRQWHIEEMEFEDDR